MTITTITTTTATIIVLETDTLTDRMGFVLMSAFKLSYEFFIQAYMNSFKCPITNSIHISSTCHSILYDRKIKKTLEKFALTPTWDAEEEEPAVADTETLTDPLAAHHLSPLAPSSSPSISVLSLVPHLPVCFHPPSPSSHWQYHLSSSCNTHLRAAAAARRASTATLSKVGFDWRMLGLVPHTQMNKAVRWYMHVAKEYQCVKADPAAACTLILFWNWPNLISYH